MKRSIALAAVLALAWAAPAFAHAHPHGLMPAKDATLAAAPKSVMIMFDEEVQPGLTGAEVKDNGRLVSVGKGTVAKNHKDLTVTLKNAGPGTYTVSWRALAADGHASHGSYSFTVKPAGKKGAKPASAKP